MIEIRVLPSGEAKYNGQPGHEYGSPWSLLNPRGFLSTNVATLPEVLRDAGYHTMLAGKWQVSSSATS